MKISAVFDGKIFIPEERVDLEPNTCYEITIGEKVSQTSPTPEINQPLQSTLWDFLEEVGGIITDGPEDWSVEHDHYIRGTPKRSEKETS